MATKKKQKKEPAMSRTKTSGMTREETKQYHAAQRRQILLRRRRLFLGGAAVALLLIVLLILRGCGAFEKNAKETTLTLGADGSITFEEVSDTKDMDFSGLKSYVKSEIKAYNKANGGKNVRLKRIKTKDSTAYVRTTYTDASTYADFTGLPLFVGTIGEALDAGYDLSDIYVSVKDGTKGKSADTAKLLEDTDAKVLILSQNIRVVLPGTISYVTDNATSVEGQMVIIAPEDDDEAVVTAIIYE